MDGSNFQRVTSSSSEPVGPSLRQRPDHGGGAGQSSEPVPGSGPASALGDHLGGGQPPSMVVRNTFLEVADSKPLAKSSWGRQHSEPAPMAHSKDALSDASDSFSELSEDDEDIIDEPPSPRITATAAVAAEARTKGGSGPMPSANFGLVGADFGATHGDAFGSGWFGGSALGGEGVHGEGSGEEAPKVLQLSESLQFRRARAQDRQKKENYVVKDVSLTKQPPPWTSVTTVMMRNLPNKYTQHMLLEELQDAGFRQQHTFDFFYLPMDHSNAANLGYCFINFTETNFANVFAAAFGGNKLRRFNSNKTVIVMPASIQGFDNNYAYYASTRVVQAEDPQYRPLFLRPPPAGKGDSSLMPSRNPSQHACGGGRGGQCGKGFRQPASSFPTGGSLASFGKGLPTTEDLEPDYLHQRVGWGGGMDYSRPEMEGDNLYGVGAAETASRYGHVFAAPREADLRIASASRLGGSYEDFAAVPVPLALPAPPPMPRANQPPAGRTQGPNFCPFCCCPIRNMFQFCPNCGASLDLSVAAQDDAEEQAASMRAQAATFVPAPDPPSPWPSVVMRDPLPSMGGAPASSPLQASLGASFGQGAQGGDPGGASSQFNKTVTDELDVMRGRMMLLAALKEMEKREVNGDGLQGFLAMSLGGGLGGGGLGGGGLGGGGFGGGGGGPGLEGHLLYGTG